LLPSPFIRANSTVVFMTSIPVFVGVYMAEMG
jgi:hypothetical protein